MRTYHRTYKKLEENSYQSYRIQTSGQLPLDKPPYPKTPVVSPPITSLPPCPHSKSPNIPPRLRHRFSGGRYAPPCPSCIPCHLSNLSFARTHTRHNCPQHSRDGLRPCQSLAGSMRADRKNPPLWYSKKTQWYWSLVFSPAQCQTQTPPRGIPHWAQSHRSGRSCCPCSIWFCRSRFQVWCCPFRRQAIPMKS